MPSRPRLLGTVPRFSGSIFSEIPADPAALSESNKSTCGADPLDVRPPDCADIDVELRRHSARTTVVRLAQPPDQRLGIGIYASGCRGGLLVLVLFGRKWVLRVMPKRFRCDRVPHSPFRPL